MQACGRRRRGLMCDVLAHHPTTPPSVPEAPVPAAAPVVLPPVLLLSALSSASRLTMMMGAGAA